MRGRSSRVWIAAVVGAIACVALPVAAAATLGPLAHTGANARAANTATFEDSRGEDGAGPDISSVEVANNDAGLITFRIALPNRPNLTPDMLVLAFVDADNNESTGDPDLLGTEYGIQLLQGSINLFRWNGTDLVGSGVPQTSLVYSYANGVLTIKISATELGSTKRFKFAVIAISGLVVNANTGDIDDTNAHRDLAPDVGHGFYAFEVKRSPLRLVVKGFSIAPRSPSAGRTFSAYLVATRSDSGAVLKGGRVSCVATVGGRRLTARVHAVVGGRATCTWAIPGSARGQTVRGSVAVAFEGLTARKSFSATIR
jgi:hypothetical protein